MAQVTINLPTMANWRTTLFGLATAGSYAAIEYFQSGGLSWRGCAAAAARAALCCLVSRAKEAATRHQLAGLAESLVVAKLAESNPQVEAASPPAAE